MFKNVFPARPGVVFSPLDGDSTKLQVLKAFEPPAEIDAVLWRRALHTIVQPKLRSTSLPNALWVGPF